LRFPIRRIFFKSDTQKSLKDTDVKLRPYLQDFSIFKVNYPPDKVRDQIKAAEDLGVCDWLLWNSRSIYTRAALKPFIQTVKPTFGQIEDLATNINPLPTPKLMGQRQE